MNRLLVINPGGGSTKIAIFEDEKCVFKATIAHSHKEISQFKDTFSQRAYREKAILEVLGKNKIDLRDFDAIVGRGGALKPLESGVYHVTDQLVEDIRTGRVQADHASNLGALIALEFAQSVGIPAYMVDPVSVDEFIPEARLSGMPEIERKSLDHPLNSKMVARKAAAEIGKRYEECNMIVAHLGTGISVSAHMKGRMIDVNNAHDGGPFSTQRTGSLPVTQLVDLCFSGKYTREEMLAKITSRGGIKAYLGTDEIQEVERRIEGGDEKAELVLRAMAYQIGKEIGGCAAVLFGEVDAIVITGGIAYSAKLVDMVKQRVRFITKNIMVYPGEHEMEAMALGALRVLRGEEKPKEYV
ncbi:MAG: butyrate kinase [bacterium]